MSPVRVVSRPAFPLYSVRRVNYFVFPSLLHHPATAFFRVATVADSSVVTTETHPEFASRDTIAVAAGIFFRKPIEAMPYSIFHHEFSDVIPC
jgi:hypothetical protein